MAKDIKDKIYIIASKLFLAMRMSMGQLHRSDVTRENVWAKIQLKMSLKPISRRLYNTWRISAVAASVLFVSMLAFMLTSNPKLVQPELVLLTNLSGANKQYVLPDSSTVLLRPNAQITYVSTGAITREVALSGEGYFEIVTDKSHPFTIQTDAGVVRVLGTKFGLKSSSASNISELVLTEGAVEFISGDATYKVKPNQKITVDKVSGDINIKTVNPDFELGWKADYLQFSNEPLIEVLSKLADIHQVSIEIKDTVLANTRFTGRLNNNYVIDKILNDLSLIIDVKHEKRNGVYVVRAK